MAKSGQTTKVSISAQTEQHEGQTEKPMCGIVMPISATADCSESHWQDVLDILTEAIEASGFESNLVSNAEDVGIIQKRIIHNLYHNPIVVCDVSSKNPNVMFELEMRLAFDKPTIIVKDDKTTYSFDTAPIEHLTYPRDLRFAKIVDFKEQLAAKVRGTHEKALQDPKYTTFLKHFGEFTVATLDTKEVSTSEFLQEEIKALRFDMRRFERTLFSSNTGVSRQRSYRPSNKEEIDICLRGTSEAKISELEAYLSKSSAVSAFRFDERPDHKHLLVTLIEPRSQGSSNLVSFLKKMKFSYFGDNRYRPAADPI